MFLLSSVSGPSLIALSLARSLARSPSYFKRQQRDGASQKATSIVLRLPPRPLFYKPSVLPHHLSPLFIRSPREECRDEAIPSFVSFTFSRKVWRTIYETVCLLLPRNPNGQSVIAIKEEAVLVRSFTLLLTAAQIIWRPIYCRFSLGHPAAVGRAACRLIYVRCSQHLESLLAPSRFPVEPRKFVQLGLRRRYCANSWLRRRRLVYHIIKRYSISSSKYRSRHSAAA